MKKLFAPFALAACFALLLAGCTVAVSLTRDAAYDGVRPLRFQRLGSKEKDNFQRFSTGSFSEIQPLSTSFEFQPLFTPELEAALRALADRIGQLDNTETKVP